MKRAAASADLLGDAEALEREGRFAEARASYEALLRTGADAVEADEGLASLILRRIARCFVEEAGVEATQDCLDAADAVIPGGTYQIPFGLAALIAAASVIPIRRIDQNNADTRPAG